MQHVRIRRVPFACGPRRRSRATRLARPPHRSSLLPIAGDQSISSRPRSGADEASTGSGERRLAACLPRRNASTRAAGWLAFLRSTSTRHPLIPTPPPYSMWLRKKQDLDRHDSADSSQPSDDMRAIARTGGLGAKSLIFGTSPPPSRLASSYHRLTSSFLLSSACGAALFSDGFVNAGIGPVRCSRVPRW